MTNKEFYGDKLLAITLERACHKLHKFVYGERCIEKNCNDCEFNTAESVEKWLNAEHVEPEPPLLENGDGLKPGDLIMVRNFDHQSWLKRSFAYFYDERFYCAPNERDLEDGTLITWRQARLPMEGE